MKTQSDREVGAPESRLENLQDPMGLVPLADRLFSERSPYEGDGLRHHCRRLHRFVQLLLAQGGGEIAPDSALLYAVAMIHDLGLVADEQPGKDYLHRSASLFASATADLPLTPQERQAAEQCLLYNHRIRKVPGLLPIAEVFRRAVWVEHSLGRLRFGLPKDAVRAVFAAFPRDNFDRVLVDFTRRVVRKEPASLLRGIFF